MDEIKTRPGASLRKLINRREFFAALVPVLSIPVFFWLILTAKRSSKATAGGLKVTIKGDVPPGITIQQGVILVRKGDHIRAFEAKCTHLGCRLSRIDGKEVVCPCHGSRFNMEGMPVKGPAGEGLRELRLQRDAVSNTIIIRSS